MITTIIPVYNSEKWLHRCINSVINQTYTDIEVIIVNDGSTDSSASICDEYASQDSRIKVIHQHNQGALKARLNALEIASGEWISFVDSDDWIELDMYESMLGIANPDSQILWGEVYLEHKDGTRTTTNFDVRDNTDYIIRQMLSGKIAGWMWNKLINKDLFFNKAVDMRSAHTMYEDLLWSIEILSQRPHISYLHKPLYHYNLTNGMAATAASPDTVLCLAGHNIALIHQFLEQHGDLKNFQNEFSILAMRYKIAEANISSIRNAKTVFAFAHKRLSSFPIHNKLARLVYWIFFNTGVFGNFLFNQLKR